VLVHGRAGLKDGGAVPEGTIEASERVRSEARDTSTGYWFCSQLQGTTGLYHHWWTLWFCSHMIGRSAQVERDPEANSRQCLKGKAGLWSRPLSRSNWNVAPARGPLPFRSAVKGGEVFPGRFLDPRSSNPIPTPYTATQHPWGLGPQPPYPTWRTKPIDSTYDRATGCVRSAHTIRSAPACTC
jgi:hypothetical protein